MKNYIIFCKAILNFHIEMNQIEKSERTKKDIESKPKTTDIIGST